MNQEISKYLEKSGYIINNKRKYDEIIEEFEKNLKTNALLSVKEVELLNAIKSNNRLYIKKLFKIYGKECKLYYERYDSYIGGEIAYISPDFDEYLKKINIRLEIFDKEYAGIEYSNRYYLLFRALYLKFKNKPDKNIEVYLMLNKDINLVNYFLGDYENGKNRLCYFQMALKYDKENNIEKMKYYRKLLKRENLSELFQNVK